MTSLISRPEGLMRCFRLSALFMAIIFAGGCAVPAADNAELKPVVNTTDTEDQARNRARIHTELAANYFEIGNLGVALESVQTAQRADPTYPVAYNIAGLIYAALKDDRRAEENFLRALQLSPADPDANNNFGQYLCQRGREIDGIRYLLNAVQNPLYQAPERSLVNAGVCARRRGDTAAAQEFFQRAIAARPNQPLALYQLADLAYAANNFAAAQGYLRRLAQAMPANAEILWLALRVERRLGNSLVEASFAQQLRNNFPDSKEAAALQAGRFE